ncbi:class I SAM-dependent methyltransferase [Aureivirga marina]|uniref:class I SAM-dependent methyltransferase n=1 Tax=Aureivirga marina TaxID=1182451 RepID=UPI0018CAF428|nr:class I SAM-dependent methyltransferase [Aureivirga marina]
MKKIPNEEELEIMYDFSLEIPTRKYVEEPSILMHLGNLKGKKILDLACRTGHYAFLFQKKEAEKIVGVDISPRMIKLANRKKEMLGVQNIEFIEKDVKDLEKLDEFDIITSIFLLNHAKSEEEVRTIAEVIYKNLKEDGIFLSCTFNFHHKGYIRDRYKNYKIDISIKEDDYSNGSPVNIEIIPDQHGRIFITDYFMDPRVYEKAFRDVGFKSFKWISLTISEEGKEKFGEKYWEEYIAYPYDILIKAIK